MSVLVEDMQMPKSCGSCKLFGASHAIGLFSPLGWCRVNGKEIFRLSEKADFCPLVEVPEPHGRLIDKDALDIYQRAEAAYAEYQEDEDNLYLEGMANGLCEAAKQLSTARTVIHASKEG